MQYDLTTIDRDEEFRQQPATQEDVAAMRASGAAAHNDNAFDALNNGTDPFEVARLFCEGSVEAKARSRYLSCDEVRQLDPYSHARAMMLGIWMDAVVEYRGAKRTEKRALLKGVLRLTIAMLSMNGYRRSSASKARLMQLLEIADPRTLNRHLDDLVETGSVLAEEFQYDDSKSADKQTRKGYKTMQLAIAEFHVAATATDVLKLMSPVRQRGRPTKDMDKSGNDLGFINPGDLSDRLKKYLDCCNPGHLSGLVDLDENDMDCFVNDVDYSKKDMDCRTRGSSPRETETIHNTNELPGRGGNRKIQEHILTDQNSQLALLLLSYAREELYITDDCLDRAAGLIDLGVEGGHAISIARSLQDEDRDNEINWIEIGDLISTIDQSRRKEITYEVLADWLWRTREIKRLAPPQGVTVLLEILDEEPEKEPDVVEELCHSEHRVPVSTRVKRLTATGLDAEISKAIAKAPSIPLDTYRVICWSHIAWFLGNMHSLGKGGLVSAIKVDDLNNWLTNLTQNYAEHHEFATHELVKIVEDRVMLDAGDLNTDMGF